MGENILEKIETNEIKNEKGIKYKYSLEIITENNPKIVHCYTVDGVEEYKIVDKPKNIEEIDFSEEWKKKIQNSNIKKDRDL